MGAGAGAGASHRRTKSRAPGRRSSSKCRGRGKETKAHRNNFNHHATPLQLPFSCPSAGERAGWQRGVCTCRRHPVNARPSRGNAHNNQRSRVTLAKFGRQKTHTRVCSSASSFFPPDLPPHNTHAHPGWRPSPFPPTPRLSIPPLYIYIHIQKQLHEANTNTENNNVDHGD